MRYEEITKVLEGWYLNSHRDLPWRRTSDPYRIWLSEIILQQTRVDQGLPYYERFTATFPDVHTLAAASEDEVLKLWQGLGYYSRARNLHAAAKYVANELDGVFPTAYDGLLKLKGVGPYTAAAIASIAFGLPHAVVDGNVNRVVARLFGVDKPVNSTEGMKEISELAEAILDRKSPGVHNQAMMELGAMVCTPKNAQCDSCPINHKCIALKRGMVGALPFKLKKVKVKERFITYLVHIHNGQVLLNKRGEGDIWQGLYDFPSTALKFAPDIAGVMDSKLMSFLDKAGLRASSISKTYKHQLTHRTIYARFVIVESLGSKALNGDSVPLTDVDNYAVPRLIERYLHDTDLLSLQPK